MRTYRMPMDEISASHFQPERLFAADGKRGETMTAEAAGVYLDYAKHLITSETMALLMADMFVQSEALAFGKKAAQVREAGTPEALVKALPRLALHGV